MQQIKIKGFFLIDVNDADIKDFILLEKQTHYKYVAEHKYFFGEWNEDVLRSAFDAKRNMTFFKKLVWNDEIVGFWCYDQKEDKIDNVFIRILEKAQNKGLGTLFLSYLQGLSHAYSIPVYLVVIKTNPAQKLYKKLGFECYKEQDVFYYFRYMNSNQKMCFNQQTSCPSRELIYKKG